MFKHHKIPIDMCVTSEVLKLYHQLDQSRGGAHGTWQSQRLNHNPFDWFAPTYMRLQQCLFPLTVDRWWFNCSAPGDENRWHSHNPCKWVAVLYIQMPDQGGAIEFKRREEFHLYMPQEGDCLVFPGNLAHKVHKNLSDSFRISAAFNLKEQNPR